MGSHTWSGSGLQPWWAWDLQDLHPPSLPFSGPDHWGCPSAHLDAPRLHFVTPSSSCSPLFLLLFFCFFSLTIFWSADIWHSWNSRAAHPLILLDCVPLSKSLKPLTLSGICLSPSPPTFFTCCYLLGTFFWGYYFGMRLSSSLCCAVFLIDL